MVCITAEPLVRTDSKRDWSIKMAEGSKKLRKTHAASWVAPLSYTTLDRGHVTHLSPLY